VDGRNAEPAAQSQNKRAMRHFAFARVRSGSYEWRRSKGIDMDILIIQPIVAFVAGILILIIPRLLNDIVAIYLIIAGIIGLLHM